jgi:hypothetical protein
LKIESAVKCEPVNDFTRTYGSAQASTISTAEAIEATPAATFMREAASPACPRRRAAPSAGNGGAGGREVAGAPHRPQNWLSSAISAAQFGHLTAGPPRFADHYALV